MSPADWGKDQAIQLEFAKAKINAILDYGKAKRWDLDYGKAKRWDLDYGKAKRWDDMAVAREALASVASRWDKDQAIQLELAIGQVNAISHYGEAKRRDDMAAAQEVLDEVGRRWDKDLSIQLRLAKGAANMVRAAYPLARQVGLQDLSLAARRCPADGQIQAIGHRHGVSFAQQVQRTLAPPLVPRPPPQGV